MQVQHKQCQSLWNILASGTFIFNEYAKRNLFTIRIDITDGRIPI